VLEEVITEINKPSKGYRYNGEIYIRAIDIENHLQSLTKTK
jgi:hypothetical protein